MKNLALKTRRLYSAALLSTSLFAGFVFPLNSFSAQEENSLQNRCIDITFQRQDRWPGLTSREIFTAIENSNLEENINTIIQERRIQQNPWKRMMVPHLKERMLGFYESILQVAYMYRLLPELGTTKESWIEWANNFFSEQGYERASSLLPGPDLLKDPTPREALRARLLAPRNYDESGLGNIFKSNPYIATFACKRLDPEHVPACVNAFFDAFKKLYNTGNTYHLGNGWLVDVLSSNDAARGGFKLVSKMLTRIASNNFEGATLIQDAKDSFVEAGYPEADAEKLSKDVILMSIIHGQISWESYKLDGIIQSYNHLNMVVAYMVAMLSAPLDTLVLKSQGYLYTNASQLKDACDNGKAYHFLVPWYIAQDLKNAGFSAQTAQAVPYVFEWGYQMFSKSYGRNPINNVTQKFDSFLNQSHRLDLTFATAGAIIGSQSLTANRTLSQAEKFNTTQSKVKPRFQRAIRKKRVHSKLRVLRHQLGRFPLKPFLQEMNQ